MTDPIADMLTRVRNAQSARHDSVSIPYSRLKENVLRILAQEGFVKGTDLVGEGVRRQIVVTLKYTGRREPVISGLKRVSKPGRRVYRGFDELSDLKPGLGTVILSTPQGILSDTQAREARVGGEVLCQIW